MSRLKPIERKTELLNREKVTFDYLINKSQVIQNYCTDEHLSNVTTKNFSVNDWGGIDLVDDRGYEISDLDMSRFARSQLCTKIGVPVAYINKCLEAGDTFLVQHNINHWIEVYEKDLLVRCFSGKIRGILSGRYSVCDTPDILRSVSEVIPVDDYDIKGFFLSEEFFHVRLVQKTPLPIDNEDLFAGISISSSDVGRSNLIVSMFVWKQVCTNGLIIPKDSGTLYHQKHLGLTAEEFRRELSDSLQYIKPITNKIIENIKSASTDGAIESMFKTPDTLNGLIQSIKNRTDLSLEDSEKVVSLMQDGTYSKTTFGMINAITEVAQTFTLSRRLELERIAGSMLMLS